MGGGSRAAPGEGSSSSSRGWAFNGAAERPTGGGGGGGGGAGAGAGAALW